MTTEIIRTTEQVASRFHELAQQEQWFQIQDELFAKDIKSLEPPGSPWLGDVEGKKAVRKKAEDWVAKIEKVFSAHTSAPLVAPRHFVVNRSLDVSVKGFGRIQMDELMLYEVREGLIVKEQFFY